MNLPDDHPAPRNEPDPDDAPAPTRKGLIYVLLALSVVAFATCLTINVLAKGDSGGTISSATSMYVSILGLVVTVMIWLVENGRIFLPITARLKRLLQVAAAAMLAGLLIGAGVSIYPVAFPPDIPVTENLVISGNHRMSDGSTATIRIPRPTDRSHLVIVTTLTNEDPTGNCTRSARRDVELLADGVVTQSDRNLPFNQERVNLSLAPVVRTAAVMVTVRMRDRECRVELSVPEARLTNDEGFR